MKGFLAVSGKPMRLLVQAVGPRVSHYYDRPWAASEARRGSLVVIGLKGLDRDGGGQVTAGLAMHLLQTSSTTFDDIVEPVDLGQTPGDIVVLSFADSDLAGLAAAYAAEQGSRCRRSARASPRSAPSDVDRSLDRQVRAPRQGDRGAAARRARLVALRGRGTFSRWRASKASRSPCCPARIATITRLDEASTLPPDELAALLAYFREGGRENLRGAAAAGLPAHAGVSLPVSEPAAGAAHGLAICRATARSRSTAWRRRSRPGAPVVPILFYRSALLAADTAPIDALCEALGCAWTRARAALRAEPQGRRRRRASCAARCSGLHPAVIVTTTAFAAGGDGEASALDGTDAPVLQAVIATTRRAAWQENPRGLGPADLAMHVVLPELDGRVLAGAHRFQGRARRQTMRSASPPSWQPARARPHRAWWQTGSPRWARLAAYAAFGEARRRADARLSRRASGRAAYAVGLDVPASIVALLEDLAAAGYRVSDAPRDAARAARAPSSAAAMRRRCRCTTTGGCSPHFPARDRRAHRTRPGAIRPTMPTVRDGAFRFRAARVRQCAGRAAA